MITALIIAALIGQAQAPVGPDRNVARNVGLLRSADRMERYEAALALAKQRSLPEDAVETIIGYIKMQVEEAMLLPAVNRAPGDARIDKIPTAGDETTISAIKANPERYIGKSFILVGGLRVSNFWGFGFRDSAYYSFLLNGVAADGQSFLGAEFVYVSKFDGAALAEMVTKTEQQQKGAALAVRIRCTIRPERIEDGEPQHAVDAIEATDWQVLRPGQKWGPWTFESIALGYRLLFLTGRNSMAKCLDIIMDEGIYHDEKTDAMLKGSAIAYLLRLPASARATILKRIPARARRTRSAVARRWAQRAAESLAGGRVVL